MCDRWFGHLMETLRATGVLDEALVIVTSDHGHSLWERRGYIGKRGYPSDPESYEVPLLVRHPQKLGAGSVCNAFVQHHDISATLLEAAGVVVPAAVDGKSFWDVAFADGPPIRDHVTVGWGSAMTVIDDKWWLNCKINGRGPFLYDSPRPKPDAPNLADKAEWSCVLQATVQGTGVSSDRLTVGVAARLSRYLQVLTQAKKMGKDHAGGSFPAYLLDQAESAIDAPGCSPFAAIR